jgi:hypothetical protein
VMFAIVMFAIVMTNLDGGTDSRAEANDEDILLLLRPYFHSALGNIELMPESIQ